MNDLRYTKALAIARIAHNKQFRRDGTTPYINHVLDVASRCTTIATRIVALMHDVLEDNETFTPEILIDFGFETAIVDAVVTLTKKEGQAYEDYLVGVKADFLARDVKIADMISNLADAPTPKQIEKYIKGLAFLTQCGQSTM